MAQAVASGESLWVNRRPSTSGMGDRDRQRVPPVPLSPRSYTPSSMNTEAAVLRVGDGAATRLGARRKEREREAAKREGKEKRTEASGEHTPSLTTTERISSCIHSSNDHKPPFNEQSYPR
jgi:hypothetical protein